LVHGFRPRWLTPFFLGLRGGTALWQKVMVEHSKEAGLMAARMERERNRKGAGK
jgi:hypothetical protein